MKDTPIGISVSHAKGFGAAAINLQGEVGIDIETERAQIHRIAHKFLHESEATWASGDGEKLTKIWTAKEALYKLHGRTQLIFAEQLVISDFTSAREVQGMILEKGHKSTYKTETRSAGQYALVLCLLTLTRLLFRQYSTTS